MTSNQRGSAVCSTFWKLIESTGIQPTWKSCFTLSHMNDHSSDRRNMAKWWEYKQSPIKINCTFTNVKFMSNSLKKNNSLIKNEIFGENVFSFSQCITIQVLNRTCRQSFGNIFVLNQLTSKCYTT